ncbi:MAG: hypothetical protein H6827_10885 [Planctomycetes bacterium]|nr:hypothetical protein [Planctomycetota bacterium]
MKYTLRKPDGDLTVATRDDLVVLWNNGELLPGAEAAPEGTDEWRSALAVIGVEAPVASGAAATSRSPCLARLANRYDDAYRVATGAGGIGTGFKVLGGLAALGGLIVAASGLSRAAPGLATLAYSDVFLGVGVILGVGAPLFALGVLLSAVGQALKATVDTAVNTSPLLTDAEKRQVIGA